MATREEIHKLVDELPDAALDPVVEFIVSRRADGAGETVEDWGNLSAMKRASASRTMRRIAQEEADAGLDPW